MDIVSNEDMYHYDVKVSYKEGDYYKVSLVNKDNNHEQIILKNDTGVYVITPSLNKSFKFESQWPNNSSQSYILDSLLSDLRNDNDLILEETDGKYIITSKVNYPNNSSLVSQKITFNKNYLPEKIEVYDMDELVCICLTITDINLKPDFNSSYFEVESNVNSEVLEETSSLDEIIYPMYLPTGTVFQGEETVDNEETQRVILTFTGDKSFIMIEEVAKIPDEFEISNTNGDLVFYENILGTLTDTSLSWTSGGKDYYIIGENLSNEELLKVASSTSTVSLVK